MVSGGISRTAPSRRRSFLLDCFLKVEMSLIDAVDAVLNCELPRRYGVIAKIVPHPLPPQPVPPPPLVVP
jgi:hypothetical protein